MTVTPTDVCTHFALYLCVWVARKYDNVTHFVVMQYGAILEGLDSVDNVII